MKPISEMTDAELVAEEERIRELATPYWKILSEIDDETYKRKASFYKDKYFKDTRERGIFYVKVTRVTLTDRFPRVFGNSLYLGKENFIEYAKNREFVNHKYDLVFEITKEEYDSALDRAKELMQ